MRQALPETRRFRAQIHANLVATEAQGAIHLRPLRSLLAIRGAILALLPETKGRSLEEIAPEAADSITQRHRVAQRDAEQTEAEPRSEELPMA